MEEDTIAVGGPTAASQDQELVATQAQGQQQSTTPAAPPSTSSLSDLQSKDFADNKKPEDSASAETSTLAPANTELSGDFASGAPANASGFVRPPIPGWEVAMGQSMNGTIAPSPPETPAQRGPRPRGRPRGSGKGASLGTRGSANSDATPVIKQEDGSTPGTAVRPRGRGGRPRGKSRGGTARGGKRKRDPDDEEGDSDSSDEVTTVATMTKSGRSIQKPTNFIPPPPSPTTAPNKRKRPYNRRNPESAVCKICLRGTSPAANMIVFCDGCNAPYHRWCHKPPIDQAIIDEVDREWSCHNCESERVIPVPEAEVADFVSAEGASSEVRQKYFSSLPPGMLVTLLTKATSLKPDLPLFPPDFRIRQANGTPAASNSGTGRGSGSTAPTSALPPPQSQLTQEQEGYGPDVHPPNYPRPGQGLMRTLPPEQDDLQWLVEDDDRHGVFTHLYRSNPTGAPPPNGAAGTAGVGTTASTA